MGFNAAEAVSSLDYDFTTIKVADPDQQAVLKSAKGTTPEPTERTVRTTNQRLAKLVGLGPEATQLDITRKMARMSEKQLEKIENETLDVYADLCGGAPSHEEITALPFRVRLAYFGWLIKEMQSPTPGSSGTRRTLAPVPSSA